MPDIFAENFNLFNEEKLDAIVINSDFFTQIQGSAIETQITNESFAILFRKNNALIAGQNSISLNDLKIKIVNQNNYYKKYLLVIVSYA